MEYYFIISLTIIANVCGLPLERIRHAAHTDLTLPVECRNINGENATKVEIDRYG